MEVTPEAGKRSYAWHHVPKTTRWITAKIMYRKKQLLEVYYDFLLHTKLETFDIGWGTFYNEWKTNCWFVSPWCSQQCLNNDDEMFRLALQSFYAIFNAIHRNRNRRLQVKLPRSNSACVCSKCASNKFLAADWKREEEDTYDGIFSVIKVRMPQF